MQLRSLFTVLALMTLVSVQAQKTWSLAGNSNATSTSKFGTTNAINLNFVTNNVERARLTASGLLGIGTTTPDASALLDVSSTTKGVLIPRMTTAQRDAIASPATGLLVFQSDGTPGFYYYDGAWKPVTTSFTGANTSLSNLSSPTAVNQHLLPSISATNNLGSGALKWRRAYLSDGLSIGTADSYAAFTLVNAAGRNGIFIENTVIGNADFTGVYARSIQEPGNGFGVQGEGGYVGVKGIGQGGSSTGYVYGVSGSASGTAGTRFGVLGFANGGNFNYGVYGTAYGGITDYAGYFNGPIYATNITTTSDRKLKQDIQPLTSGLEQLLKLRPATYQYKTKEYKHMNLPEGKQVGLVADEVKQVFPQLVRSVVQPAQYNEKDRTKEISPEVKFEGVNYQGLIPVLIASIQEQQQQIMDKDEKIANLEARLQKIEALLNGSNSLPLNSATLLQNVPNPVNGTTTIRYQVPTTAKTASILLTDVKGQQLKAIVLSNRGSAQVSLDTQGLASGTYNYTLYVDGQPADTKRLVVTR